MTDLWSSRLSEYLDGDLAAGDRRDLENHLSRCRDCQEELAALRRVVGRLDRAPDHEPEQDLWPSLAEQLAHQERDHPGQHGWRSTLRSMAASLGSSWVPAATAAAVALALAAVWILGPWTKETSPPGPGEDSIAPYRAMAQEWRDLVDVSNLPEPIAASVTADLESFERAIRETVQALEEHPGDQEIELHLIRTLRAQARLLSRIETSTEAL